MFSPSKKKYDHIFYVLQPPWHPFENPKKKKNNDLVGWALA
jgi:hypothetical protein